jgi:uncharacterized damage-inducible protein DinB
MEPKEIQTIFSYNYWAFDRVWACIEKLTDAQFTQEVDYSRGSIRNQVVHLMSATRRWMERLQKKSLSERLANEDFPTLAVTRVRWDELRDEMMDVIDSLTREHLDENIHWELKERGYVADNKAWEVLLHAANHGTDHRAQILAILNQHFGIETVEQDMIIYLREREEKPV